MTICTTLIRYPGLVTYSERGVRMPKDITARVEHTKAAFESIGAKVTACYSTLGRYDALMVLEFPNEGMTSRLDQFSDASARIEILRVLSPESLERILASPA